MFGFLLNRKAISFGIEFGDPVALRVIDPIAEDGSLAVFLRFADSIAQKARESGAVAKTLRKTGLLSVDSRK